jgi:hypothetical protein
MDDGELHAFVEQFRQLTAPADDRLPPRRPGSSPLARRG